MRVNYVLVESCKAGLQTIQRLGPVRQPGFRSVLAGFHMKILPETGLLTAFYYKTGNRPGFPNGPLWTEPTQDASSMT
jgi:hypothetical protein